MMMKENGQPEPSVLDYLKAKLTPWKGPAPDIPKREAMEEGFPEPGGLPPGREGKRPAVIWYMWLPVALALIAQRSLEPGDRNIWVGITFYALAGLLLVWLIWRGEWSGPDIPPSLHMEDPLTIKSNWFYIFIPLAVFTFLAFGSLRFDGLNLFLWLLTVVALLKTFWVSRGLSFRDWFARLREGIAQRTWWVRITPWAISWVGVFGLAVFFRFYRLGDVPPEMISDHAEKLLDVADVLRGNWWVFFPRNTGREAIQMVVTALVARVLGTGLTYLSLKIGTALAGVLTLPYVYLLGKEVGGKRVGLWAMLFAGIAYWPNVISRIALRFAFYPLFVAPTLYYLIRGLRNRNRNDLLLAGLALGLGLHGYSPFRFVPFLVLLGVGLYLLHRVSKGARVQTIWALVALVLVSFVVFLPLLRYALAEPANFSYRTLTRIGTMERSYPDSPVRIFFDNLWGAVTMFFWDDGSTWVHSVTHRPALDVVSGALFFLGVVFLLTRYIRRRQWEDAFLLLSIPMLLMPSVLSLAFPAENPSLNRTGGAIVPVFVVVGILFEGFLTSLKSAVKTRAGGGILWGAVFLLLSWSSIQNYDLVFDQYFRQMRQNTWNTSEIGHVIRSYADSIGEAETAWVVPFPHWVDTRVVGINVGLPEKDYALWGKDLPATLEIPPPKLFIYKPEDELTGILLTDMYPSGILQRYVSAVEGKDFMIFLVP
ncbi:MAG: glycosyltransferase family 39 protein [Chloroflexota bacterium]